MDELNFSFALDERPYLSFGMPEDETLAKVISVKGEAGEDGFSPIVTISKTGKVTTVTITDATGDHTATINDGEDGTGGDMLKSTYDTNGSGVVDNAEAVNGHTVAKDVPANAVFTDTVYDDTAIKTAIANKVDKEDGKSLSTNDYTDNEKTKLAGIETGAEANTQSNWTETDSASDAYIKNKPTLSTVATSGSYNDLSNTPTLATVATSGSYSDLGDKPTIPSNLSDLSGTVSSNQIASNAVIAAKIASNAVTTAKINGSAVTNAKIDWTTITPKYGNSTAISANSYTPTTFGLIHVKAIISTSAYGSSAIVKVAGKTVWSAQQYANTGDYNWQFDGVIPVGKNQAVTFETSNGASWSTREFVPIS